jgi:hypothetical protein
MPKVCCATTCLVVPGDRECCSQTSSQGPVSASAPLVRWQFPRRTCTGLWRSNEKILCPSTGDQFAEVTAPGGDRLVQTPGWRAADGSVGDRAAPASRSRLGRTLPVRFQACGKTGNSRSPERPDAACGLSRGRSHRSPSAVVVDRLDRSHHTDEPWPARASASAKENLDQMDRRHADTWPQTLSATSWACVSMSFSDFDGLLHPRTAVGDEIPGS